MSRLSPHSSTLHLCLYSIKFTLFFILFGLTFSSETLPAARCDAHTLRILRILTVWDSQKPPSATSRLSLRQLCVCRSVVLWWGVGCAQLRVIIWWWARDGKTCGLRSSGHAVHPQLANQHRVPEVSKVQGTYNETLWYSISHRPH